MITTVCPVCAGRGFVDAGFYTTTTGQWSATNTGTEQCHSCKGTGYLVVVAHKVEDKATIRRSSVEHELYNAFMGGYASESYGLAHDYENEAFRLERVAKVLLEHDYVNYASEIEEVAKVFHIAAFRESWEKTDVS